MKLQFKNSLINNNMLKHEQYATGQLREKGYTPKNNYNDINTTRPAQLISFSGSAVSLGKKIGNAFLESNKVNKLIGVVADNEAKFKAVFALILAGMIKPGLVLKQTGFNDKDGQLIATKNSLQAFVGYALEGTIAAGFVKKIWDVMENNFRMMEVVKENGSPKAIRALDSQSEEVLKVAENTLKKSHKGLIAKFSNAKNVAAQSHGIEKITGFFKNFKNPKYVPNEADIEKKAEELVKNLKDNHLQIFNKDERIINYTAKLVENMHLTQENAKKAKEALNKAMRSQSWDAFESSFKNITNVATVITKAKISSILLPIVVAAIFAGKEIKDKDATKIALDKSKEKNNLYAKVTSKEKNSAPSFKGSSIDKALNASTKVFEKLAVSKPGEALVNWVSKVSKKPSHLWSHIESFGITFYWLINTHFSKKIEPDQKLGLNIHTALVTIISSLASLIIDTVSDNLIGKAENGYKNKIVDAAKSVKDSAKNLSDKELAEKFAKECSKLYNSKEILEKFKESGALKDNAAIEKAASSLATTYSKHLGKLKSLTIFTLVVRFLVPVLTVKQSKKIKKKLVKFSKDLANKKETDKTKTNKTEDNKKAEQKTKDSKDSKNA